MVQIDDSDDYDSGDDEVYKVGQEYFDEDDFGDVEVENAPRESKQCKRKQRKGKKKINIEDEDGSESEEKILKIVPKVGSFH